MPDLSSLQFWADIFTITTGVVIAVAATLAFVVQRARYRREVEPDLRFENCWADSPPSIDGDDFIVLVHITVANRSSVSAFNLRLTATISWAPHVATPLVGLRPIDSPSGHGVSVCVELAPQETVPLVASAASSIHPTGANGNDIATSLVGLTHFGLVTVKYESDADLAHRFLTPFRSRFRRTTRRALAVSPYAWVSDGVGGQKDVPVGTELSLHELRLALSLTGTTESRR